MNVTEKHIELLINLSGVIWMTHGALDAKDWSTLYTSETDKERLMKSLRELNMELIKFIHDCESANEPAAPEPPTFAVGTRVLTLAECGDLPKGLLGTIMRFYPDRPDVVYVLIDLDNHSYPFELRELEPIPVEPAQPAPVAAALPEGVTVNDELTIYDDNDVGTSILFTVSEQMLRIEPDSADMETSIDIERAIKLHQFLGQAIETMKANAIAYKREQQAREMKRFEDELGGDNGR